MTLDINRGVTSPTADLIAAWTQGDQARGIVAQSLGGGGGSGGFNVAGGINLAGTGSGGLNVGIGGSGGGGGDGKAVTADITGSTYTEGDDSDGILIQSVGGGGGAGGFNVAGGIFSRAPAPEASTSVSADRAAPPARRAQSLPTSTRAMPTSTKPWLRPSPRATDRAESSHNHSAAAADRADLMSPDRSTRQALARVGQCRHRRFGRRRRRRRYGDGRDQGLHRDLWRQ